MVPRVPTASSALSAHYTSPFAFYYNRIEYQSLEAQFDYVKFAARLDLNHLHREENLFMIRNF